MILDLYNAHGTTLDAVLTAEIQREDDGLSIEARYIYRSDVA